LYGEIRAAESRVIISRDGLRLHLHKATSEQWTELVTDLPKSERMARRQASIDARFEELREAKQEKKTQRVADDKKALHSHFDMEDSRKRWIEDKKEKELNAQADELEQWQKKEAIAAAMLAGEVDDAEDDVEASKSRAHESSLTRTRRRRKKKTSEEMFDKSDLPPPRSANVVKISFTKTTRPTPARADNTDHIGPNDAPRSKPVLKRVHNPDVVDIGEQNPVWLKDRGDQYFALGDFASAANAYSAAISLDDDEYVATIAGRVSKGGG
jgi:dyslexia susceptibility 1 candidate gene 1 protein